MKTSKIDPEHNLGLCNTVTEHVMWALVAIPGHVKWLGLSSSICKSVWGVPVRVDIAWYGVSAVQQNRDP